MKRGLLAAPFATLGWWMGILIGITLGGLIGFLVSPVVGRALGGLLAGVIGGAIEARSSASLRGMRLRFTGATALATALATVLLLGVESMPWLVGGVFGGAIAAAQAVAIGLARRAAISRVLTSAAAWSLGFAVLHHGGTYGKLGVLAPGLAVLLLALCDRLPLADSTETLPARVLP